uniref:Uncharacterized protein n=1 Tax=Salix viminalis TaxID=40686 RepID=A0A6N2KFY4_SALVM
MNIIKPKPNPQQQLRDWQRRLRQESRNTEHIQREEKTVQKAIRDAAKRNDMVSAKALAKEIVTSRRTVNRLYENKAQNEFNINASWRKSRDCPYSGPFVKEC